MPNVCNHTDFIIGAITKVGHRLQILITARISALFIADGMAGVTSINVMQQAQIVLYQHRMSISYHHDLILKLIREHAKMGEIERLLHNRYIQKIRMTLN